MEINQQALEEFKKIYKKEFGEDLSDDEALDMARRVLGFFSLIYRPLPDEGRSSECAADAFDNPQSVDYDQKNHE